MTQGEAMNHIWKHEEWRDLRLAEARQMLLRKIREAPRLGDLTVRQLCVLATDGDPPVGLYIFVDGDEIIYAGKTHGRSLHERMVSHVEHREPIPGSPHLARLVQSMIKNGQAKDGKEASEKVLNLRILWMPVPGDIATRCHKNLIAVIERRLLWNGCLNPRMNSPRVRNADTFSLQGEMHQLTPDVILGSPVAETLLA